MSGHKFECVSPLDELWKPDLTDDSFDDMETYDRLLEDYKKWSGLGSHVVEQKQSCDYDDDDDAQDNGPDKEPIKSKSLDPLPPFTPDRQQLPEPPNDNYKYEQHFAAKLKAGG